MHERSARVLLVDDNPAILRHVIELMPPEFDVVETLEDGGELEDAVTRHQPDVVILDITLPHASGFELAARIARRDRPPSIVLLTVHDDPDYVAAAFAAGAAAYVVKMRLSIDLVPALHAVLDGGRFVSSGVSS